MNSPASALDPETRSKEITEFSVDSRSLSEGEIFFAISPEDYRRAGFNGTFEDGHRFIPEAFSRGAVAAVARTERVRGDESLRRFAGRLIAVEDAIEALQLLARRVYEAWNQPVVAITGSAGKTTAKELTAHVLSAAGRRVLKSERNYNNGLGLPLSVLRMVTGGRQPGWFDTAVLEMGMSSPTHEIARLCRITPPDIGVELLVAPVHLEYLGTMENIAAAKAELIEGLKPGGTAVLNADDPLVMAMREKHRGGRLVTFGIENEADVRPTDINATQLGQSRFVLHTPLGVAPAELALSGRHNLSNALAAAAVATCFEIPAEAIAGALHDVRPPKMRGEVLRFAAGFEVIDDSYNSNPRSLMSMVETVVHEGARSGRRVRIIAGEMLELGPDAERLHRETGEAVARLGVYEIWGIRGLAADLVEGARRAGMEANRARYFESSEEAAAALVREVTAGDLTLVKGSRGVQTDKVVDEMRERFPLAVEGE